MATRGEPRTVTVEVWSAEAPTGLREVHRGVLDVGDHGVEVGSEDGGDLTRLSFPAGQYALQVWVDGDKPDQVRRVAFVLPAGTPLIVPVTSRHPAP